MIDLRILRDDPDVLRAAQRRRRAPEELVDALEKADGERRAAIAEYERLRSEQKALGKQIPNAEDAHKRELLERAKELAGRVRAAEARQAEAAERLRAAALALPNPGAIDAPPGGEDDYVVLHQAGAIRDFSADGFQPRDHVELGRLLGAIDIERGAKVSGSRFYYLTGAGAMLELALLQLAMDQAIAAGFIPMIPPALVRPRAMEGTGFLGQAADDVFRIPADDFYLVGTSEVPVAAYHSDEVLDAATLPRRYAAFSPCYRREAGSYGKDTRGIFRVHWFDKVEMFTFTTLEEAAGEHQRLLGEEREFLDKLELPYRVIDKAAGDLGLPAARTYDCEAWIPSQGRYREVTSTSNCTDFQARRLDIRTRRDDGVEPVATLNGTLCAMARMIVALLENHQLADGSVRVPTALQPYLGGRTTLKPIG